MDLEAIDSGIMEPINRYNLKYLIFFSDLVDRSSGSHKVFTFDFDNPFFQFKLSVNQENIIFKLKCEV